MTNGKPNPMIIDALQNGVGALISRLMIVIGVPAIMGMGVWIGERMVGELDHLSHKVDTQHDETMRSIGGLDARLTGTEHDIVFLKDRIK